MRNIKNPTKYLKTCIIRQGGGTRSGVTRVNATADDANDDGTKTVHSRNQHSLSCGKPSVRDLIKKIDRNLSNIE